MGCCGEIKKVASVTKGYVTFVADWFGLPAKKHPDYLLRLHTCRNCDANTWMTPSGYLTWIKDHGLEVVSNLDDLTRLPDLPKEEYSEGRKLFCRKCKCFLPAKTMAENEHCPIGKW